MLADFTVTVVAVSEQVAAIATPAPLEAKQELEPNPTEIVAVQLEPAAIVHTPVSTKGTR